MRVYAIVDVVIVVVVLLLVLVVVAIIVVVGLVMGGRRKYSEGFKLVFRSDHGLMRCNWNLLFTWPMFYTSCIFGNGGSMLC